VDPQTAATWFDALREGVAWQSERRPMYDRDVDVPRLVARYRLDDSDLPPTLADAAERTSQATGTPFNTVGLNYYRDGRDSVAPHNDHLYEIVAEHPIALISLGATRLMTIRSKPNVILSSVEGRRRILDLNLENGSLLVMSYETQLHYDHGVPKTKNPADARISIALRVRPAAAPARSAVLSPVEGSG
jgi:alkylated DNA repair dioxygenase AlkB